MYYDSNNQGYGHNHAVYKCLCGEIVNQCPCNADDKEEIVFDSCWCKTKHTHNSRVVRKIFPGRDKDPDPVELPPLSNVKKYFGKGKGSPRKKVDA